MEVPGYSLAERDRRRALARAIMAAENVRRGARLVVLARRAPCTAAR